MGRPSFHSRQRLHRACQKCGERLRVLPDYQVGRLANRRGTMCRLFYLRPKTSETAYWGRLTYSSRESELKTHAQTSKHDGTYRGEGSEPRVIPRTKELRN
jgi:hypothetical protein